MQEFDLVVVGAGIVGASVAWHAAQRGLRVAVVDGIGPAAGASGASDGAVSVASKREGILADVAYESLEYSKELAKKNGPLAGIFHARPSFFVATDEAEEGALDALAIKLRKLGNQVKVVADLPNQKAVALGFGSGVRRLLKLDGEGHMLGYGATQAYLRASGAAFFWRDAVIDIAEEVSSVTVQCQSGKLRARAVVCAAGLQSLNLFESLPIFPRAGQLIITDQRQPNERTLEGSITAGSYLISKQLVKNETLSPPVVIDPLETGQYLIGSTREPHGRSDFTDVSVIRNLIKQAVDIYPVLKNRRVIRTFTGVRAAVADGLPIVGLMPQHRRTWIASGFEGDGICLSAWAGRAVCDAIFDKPKGVLDVFSPNRFQEMSEVV